jgi:hypothetical protein
MAVLVCGCGRGEVEEGAPALPAWLTEDEDAPAEDTNPSTPSGQASDPGTLPLTLHPGDRFPLRKVVQQELTQASLDGVPQISRSHLELVLAITVDEVRPDRKRLSVRYEHVKYSHEVAGEFVAYDSAAPPAQIPPSVLAYHCLVNNGFAFELGADNQIAGVIGFREFLERCLQHVPPDLRQRVILDIEANAGEKGIADFVDSTIGLLPAGVDKVIGESWDRTRHIGRPLPMQINCVYTLQNLTDGTAEISIAGTITPSTTLGQSAVDDQNLRITVEGGHTQGHCTLFRGTGLPKESRVERHVDMTVHVAGGSEFTQKKRTLTTIESLSAQSPSPVATAVDINTPRFQ